jgi:hypothetical protein
MVSNLTDCSSISHSTLAVILFETNEEASILSVCNEAAGKENGGMIQVLVF